MRSSSSLLVAVALVTAVTQGSPVPDDSTAASPAAAAAAAAADFATNEATQLLNNAIESQNGLPQVGQTFVGSSGVAVTVTNIVPVASNSTTLDKRDGISYVTTTNTQVVQSGTWWNGWVRTTPCQFCAQGPCGVELEATISQSYNQASGPDAQTVINIINANGNLNQGYTWTTSQTYTSLQSCTGNTNSDFSVWGQHLMGWDDAQTQTCNQLCTPQKCEPKTCGAWSAYERGNYPLLGKGNINFGCSQNC